MADVLPVDPWALLMSATPLFLTRRSLEVSFILQKIHAGLFLNRFFLWKTVTICKTATDKEWQQATEAKFQA
jgi:hypothetical protein